MDSEMRDGAFFKREMRFQSEEPTIDQCEFDLHRWCGRIHIQRFMRLTKRGVNSSFDLIRSFFLSIRQAPNAKISFLGLNNLRSGIRWRTTSFCCRTLQDRRFRNFDKTRRANRFQSVEGALRGTVRTWIIPHLAHSWYHCNFKETNLVRFDKLRNNIS